MGYDEPMKGNPLYTPSKSGRYGPNSFDGLTLANGMGWSPDGKTLYFIDTPTKKVGSFTLAILKQVKDI